MSENRNDTLVNRRDLVAGACAGAAAAALSCLGSAAAQADEAGGSDAAAAVPEVGHRLGDAVAWENANPAVAPIAPVEPPEQWDREAEVVVVGAGGGGLNAAARLAENGVSVILIEKTALLGGNTASAGGSIVMGNSRYMEAVEGALPNYPWEPQKWLDWKQEHCNDALNSAMQLAVAENMGPAHDWMGDCGVPWYVVWGNTFIPATFSKDHLAAAAQADVTNIMAAYGAEQGAEYLTSTGAEALVVDADGRVVGVKASDERGDDLYLHATRGVIMCAGGFAANKEMLKAYCPTALAKCNNCYVAQCDSGECIRMGLGVGGLLVDKDSFAMFDGGLPYEAHGGEWCTYLYNGANQLARQPWLTLDSQGNRLRYITTSDGLGMAGGALTRQANVQTSGAGNRSYIFFDATYEQVVMERFDETDCRQPLVPGMDRMDEKVPEHFHDWRTGASEAIETGVFQQADTIEELAEKLGLDPQAIADAVQRWNDACEAGADDATYPYDPAWLVPIAQPPFYGAELGGILFRTNTGLAINTNMQMLKADGTAVPGLYAGWFTAAGYAADGYISSIKYAGEGISLSYTGGYMAANALMALEV